MRRREVLKLAALSTLIIKLNNESQVTSTPKDSQELVTVQASTGSITAKISIDSNAVVARTTSYTFGSNDYEITTPAAAADTVYQSRLAEIGIPLIRVHHAELSDRWTKPATRTWDEAKIRAGYDASYPQRPTIIQNIPKWPQWMAVDRDGILNPSEYDNYASFCAELVNILNIRQQRKIIYWEPLNERENAYQNAGKLNELWKIYNKVAVAMKAKDPTIKVGGPALTWNDTAKLVLFLQACKANVDFISWHRYASGDANESTDKIMSYTPNYGAQVREFRAIATKYIPNRKVPLLLGEYNINYSWDSGENRQNTHIGAVWFASVFKHLAEAGIDMATSWHLKDGIYGMLDPQNKLRPSATVFTWAIKYLIGRVIGTKSDHPFIEAMTVYQANGTRSLLLINKAAVPARLTFQEVGNSFFGLGNLSI